MLTKVCNTAGSKKLKVSKNFTIEIQTKKITKSWEKSLV